VLSNIKYRHENQISGFRMIYVLQQAENAEHSKAISDAAISSNFEVISSEFFRNLRQNVISCFESVRCKVNVICGLFFLANGTLGI
jgi:hypothetical protein